MSGFSNSNLKIERLESDEIPLHTASRSGISNMAWDLLDRGTDINQKDKNGLTALHLASRHGEINMVRLLLARGASLHDKTDEGNNALMLASFRGHEDVVELLMDSGANFNEKNYDENTALHMASDRGYKDLAELLIVRGANIHDKDCEGYTALHHAAIKGHSDVVKLLIDHGANINDQNNDGITACDLALDKGREDIGALFEAEFERTLDKYIALLVIVIKENSSENWTNIIEMLERNPHLIEVYSRTTNYQSALLIAVNQRSTAAVRLVMMGANMNRVDKNGQTALSIASNSYNELIRNFFTKNSSKDVIP